MVLIPVVNAIGAVVDSLDTEADGVMLLYEMVGFAAGEPSIFVGDPDDFDDTEEGEPDEWEVQQAALDDWQLYRRSDGTYALCSWVVADAMRGMPDITGRAVETLRSYCARILNAREATTFVVQGGLEVLPIMHQDFVDQAAYEAAALERATEVSDSNAPWCFYFGDGKLLVDGVGITIEDAEIVALETLVELRTCNLRELIAKSGHDKAARLLKRITEKHPALKRHIKLPGGRGKGGCSTTIVKG